jgi:hypothetical protein
MAKTEKLEIKLKPFTFGGTRVEFKGTTYYIKSKNINEQGIYDRLETFSKVLNLSSDLMQKGGRVTLKYN